MQNSNSLKRAYCVFALKESYNPKS